MAQLDLSGIGTFVPVFGFLLVFVVTYALLGKTKILGENKFVHILTSFVIAILFLVSANAVKYVSTVTPWFVAFVISLLFIGIVVGVMGEKPLEKIFNPTFAWFVVIILIVVFVASAVYVFKDVILGPGHFNVPSQIIGAIVLLAITVFASWLLTRK